MTLSRLIFTILILVLSKFSGAQNHLALLDRKISTNFSNVELKEALFELSKLGQFNLSYNSEILPPNRIVNFKANPKRISEILPQILPSQITYKTSGNSLILLKKSAKEIKKSDIVITGNVFDSINKTQISEATVVAIHGSQSVITDSLGNFMHHITHKQQELVLNISKFGYYDTLLFLKPVSQTIKVHLTKIEAPLAKIETLPIKSIETYPISRFMIPEDLLINTQNITGYSKKKFQLSLTPGTSTNLKMAGLVKNDVSINLIGGYNYGVGKLELGGAFNINRTNVSGFQAAGAGNLVGGDVKGIQLAGALNTTQGNQTGLQAAGFGNFNSSNFVGAQLSGAVNFSGNFYGLQIAGGVNVADSLYGLQLSTLFNKTNDLKGLQLSSGLNVCDTMTGIQIGIVNRAKQNSGLQIGIVNYNNSSSGLSIGILNFVKNKKFPRILFAYH